MKSQSKIPTSKKKSPRSRRASAPIAVGNNVGASPSRRAAIKAVRDLLSPVFTTVSATPFLEHLIRVEVVDARFDRLSFLDRHQLINPILDQLDPDILDRLGKITLLAPGEEH